MDREYDEKVVAVVDKALLMKISIDALLDRIEEERDRYRERLQIMAESNEGKKIQYLTNPNITDEDIDQVAQYENMLGGENDIETNLDIMFSSKEKALESLRSIDGVPLLKINTPTLLNDAEIAELRIKGIQEIIEVAVLQSSALVNDDEYSDFRIFTDAYSQIRTRLGLAEKK